MLPAAEHILADLRYSLRRLRRAPGFLIVSTSLIAVALAASTAIFGLTDVLLLRTLLVRDPGSLVQVFEVRPAIPVQGYVSSDLFDLIKTESRTLTDLIGDFDVTASLERETATSSVNVGLVTPGYFEGLGVAAVLGRTLSGEDEVTGDRVAIVSHRAWTRYFARDPAVVGRTVRLAGQPYEIVGVLPEGFNGTAVDRGPDFRVLFAHRADFGATLPLTSVVARLGAGESLESANVEARALWSRFRAERAAGGGVIGPLDRDVSVEVRSIARGTSRVREQFQPTLLLLFGGAALVLAMVCVNVGGLLLARIVQAKRDAALRRALGASHARIARQWAVESMLVAVIGGVFGLALAAAAMPALVRWLSPLIGFGGFGQPPTLEVSFDLRIAAFGVGAILATGLLAALVPMLWGKRKEAYAMLKASLDDRQSSRIQSALSVVQVAVSTVLLLGGGLMLHTLARLDRVDAGFDRELLVRFAIDPRLANYDGPAANALLRRLLEETPRLPGVQAAAVTGSPVMQGIGLVMAVSPPGGPPELDSAWNTNVNRVTAGYFAAMGIELMSGAVFDDEPIARGEPTPVVVNVAFARRFFGDQDAVGGVFDLGREFQKPAYRIVGVVADANYRSLREANPPIFYANPLSFPPDFAGDFSLLVRTTTPDAIIGPVRELVRSIDAALPVLEAVTMGDEVARSLWRERLAAALTSAFAIIGLAVAAIGLYAILAHYVASRRKEIGLRMALGAMARDVLALVARRVAPIMLLGLLLGIAAHVALSRFAASLLYDVSTLDPLTVVAASATVLAMALLAAMVPVLQATAVDPARTLRDD